MPEDLAPMDTLRNRVRMAEQGIDALLAGSRLTGSILERLVDQVKNGLPRMIYEAMRGVCPLCHKRVSVTQPCKGPDAGTYHELSDHEHADDCPVRFHRCPVCGEAPCRLTVTE